MDQSLRIPKSSTRDLGRSSPSPGDGPRCTVPSRRPLPTIFIARRPSSARSGYGPPEAGTLGDRLGRLDRTLLADESDAGPGRPMAMIWIGPRAGFAVFKDGIKVRRRANPAQVDRPGTPGVTGFIPGARWATADGRPIEPGVLSVHVAAAEQNHPPAWFGQVPAFMMKVPPGVSSIPCPSSFAPRSNRRSGRTASGPIDRASGPSPGRPRRRGLVAGLMRQHRGDRQRQQTSRSPARARRR